MAKIKEVRAREILDSRGNPTVETKIILDDLVSSVASVPSGASLGKYEALELRDNDPKRYGGMGVLKAVENVNKIIGPRLVGIDPTKQFEIDQFLVNLDGTPNKNKLGANSLLSVSMAVARSGALTNHLPLYKHINNLDNTIELPHSYERMPTPTFNIINGGKHGAGNLDFQEFHVIPATNKSYHEALEMGEEIYQSLKQVLTYRNAIHSIGDEGGFAPNLFTNVDALESILQAVRATKYRVGTDVFFGLDLAADQFKKDGKYEIKDRPEAYSTKDFVSYLTNLHKIYHLLLLEDPLSDNDFAEWANLTSVLGNEVYIVGDDLLATNIERLKTAISQKSCNTILVKPNQIGTITETLAVIRLARQNKFKIIVSHRSGETNDDFIADFSVGVVADYVKFGAPVRGERVAKYNRLLEIEEEIINEKLVK